ncbi:hypothetical protein SETIT_5G036600v2 [Setaria italica]|uniref:Uncharacterized protein n=1 Tax=Setaria italica TaxID=4555 RepID=A0A368R0V6_SETIT|nr:hypothetical protein SETIT_5G036600v2 [Setaria italica]
MVAAEPLVTLPADAFNFDSNSQNETDSSEDHHRGYRTPFPRGDTLRVFRHADNTFVCPICPGTRHRWRILNEVKDHILGMAKSAPLRGENKEKWSHHCIEGEVDRVVAACVREQHQYNPWYTASVWISAALGHHNFRMADKDTSPLVFVVLPSTQDVDRLHGHI